VGKKRNFVALLILEGAALSCAARNEPPGIAVQHDRCHNGHCRRLEYTANAYRNLEKREIVGKSQQFFIVRIDEALQDRPEVPVGSTIVIDKSLLRDNL
jgi:hypothetical protein